MSQATIDRLLRPYPQRRPFNATMPGSLLKAGIPIRTIPDGDGKCPGLQDMDLVAHCGESTEGFYLNTLSAVDVSTGWWSAREFGKGQRRVGAGCDPTSSGLHFTLEVS